jgi:hypothetical protein
MAVAEIMEEVGAALGGLRTKTTSWAMAAREDLAVAGVADIKEAPVDTAEEADRASSPMYSMPSLAEPPVASRDEGASYPEAVEERR